MHQALKQLLGYAALICISDIFLEATQLLSLSSNSPRWPFISYWQCRSSTHGRFDERKEREAVTSHLINCWGKKSCWHRHSLLWDGDLVGFTLQALMNCWCKALENRNKNTDLFNDAVQCFWSANVETDENSIRVGVRQRPYIVIIRRTCNTQQPILLDFHSFKRISVSICLFVDFNLTSIFIPTIWLFWSIKNSLRGDLKVINTCKTH